MRESTLSTETSERDIRRVTLADGSVMVLGTQKAGDGWVDARGMFEAAVGAGPVYRLLGRQGLQSDTFPPVDTALLQSDIGFKQHPYTHTDTPTWRAFLEFAQKYFSTR